MKPLFILLLMLCVPGVFHAADALSALAAAIDSRGAFVSNGYVYVRGQSEADANTTPEAAMAKARQDCKAKIAEFSGGFATRTLDQTTFFNEAKISGFVQAAVRSRADAYIAEFEVLTNTRAFIADSTFLRTRIYARAKVVKVTGKAPQFNIKASLNGARFKPGDRMEVKVTSALEGWIYLFIVEENGNATQLYPNSYGDTNRLTPGAAFQMPTKKERDMTAFYEMSLPEGRKETVEMLRVIVTKTPFPAAGIAAFDDFATRFASIPSDEVEYADLAYQIR